MWLVIDGLFRVDSANREPPITNHESRSYRPAQFRQCLDDSLRPSRDFLICEGSIGRLEFHANENRVRSGRKFPSTENLGRFNLLQFGDSERDYARSHSFERDLVVEDEREITRYRRESRNRLVTRLPQLTPGGGSTACCRCRGRLHRPRQSPPVRAFSASARRHRATSCRPCRIRGNRRRIAARPRPPR